MGVGGFEPNFLPPTGEGGVTPYFNRCGGGFNVINFKCCTHFSAPDNYCTVPNWESK